MLTCMYISKEHASSNIMHMYTCMRDYIIHETSRVLVGDSTIGQPTRNNPFWISEIISCRQLKLHIYILMLGSGHQLRAGWINKTGGGRGK